MPSILSLLCAHYSFIPRPWTKCPGNGPCSIHNVYCLLCVLTHNYLRDIVWHHMTSHITLPPPLTRCMPEFANVIPTAFPVDRVRFFWQPRAYTSRYNLSYSNSSPSYFQPTMHYNYNLKKLVLSYAAIVCAHYLVVFLLLLCIYHKILKHIKKLKRVHSMWNSIYPTVPHSPTVCPMQSRTGCLAITGLLTW